MIAYHDELKDPLPQKEPLPKPIFPPKFPSYVDLWFNKPYIVPARGDNRCALSACFLIDSPDITKIREEKGLQPLYSPTRPLRFTFGIVRNEACRDNDETILARLRRCLSLAPWFDWMEKKSF